MKIGVISDTHLYQVSADFVQIVEKFLQDCDLLIHCGDYTGEEIYHYLNSFPNFVGIKGNCDFFSLEEKKVVCHQNKKIGIIHGYGVSNLGRNPENLLPLFPPDTNLICFGHTHTPLWKKVKQTYLLNPGSLAFNGTLALVSWEQEVPEMEFISL